jgi:hypothetical protein
MKRLPIVSEVSGSFCGCRVPCGQRDGSLCYIIIIVVVIVVIIIVIIIIHVPLHLQQPEALQIQ